MQKKFFYLVLFLFSCLSIQAQPIKPNSKPFIGAQLFIEPGQTVQQLDQWFSLMQESGMEVCRIRMFGHYMKTSNGDWDFSLFDRAFRLADKYKIKVYATLFPDTDFSDVGGFKFPHTQEHQKEIAEYIRQVVTHFSSYSCLSTWVLINEPGAPNISFDEPFTNEKFAAWKKEHLFSDYNEQGYPILNFEKEKFIVDYHNWYLKWLANQVRQYDAVHDLHVNPHNIFKLSGCYDFPAWRSFLNSLGGSAHASWHFSYFPRNRYNIAMSANAELIRSGAGNLPWIMTELQGGNNIYSGAVPLCPTAEEITQWLWINLATETKGEIFWSFNPRATGAEAGEWAMIDFRNRSTDRLKAASNVAKFINEHSNLMSHIQTLNSGISILYNRASMWVESSQTQSKTNNDGRSTGAAMCSAISYFESLSELGIQTSFREFEEFDFSLPDYINQVIILSQQIALSTANIKQLEQFVQRGGTLIADGLTGFYDENAHSTFVSNFALDKLFGGHPIEFKLIDKLFKLNIENHKLPVHLWQGSLETTGASVLASSGKEPIASINHFGKGRAIWVPSPLGLGARHANEYSVLAKWITEQLPEHLLKQNLHFSNPERGIMMKSFQSEGFSYSIIINKTSTVRTVFVMGGNINTSSILFADKAAKIKNRQVTIAPEGTIVIQWK